jgi:hypothetical protein
MDQNTIQFMKRHLRNQEKILAELVKIRKKLEA